MRTFMKAARQKREIGRQPVNVRPCYALMQHGALDHGSRGFKGIRASALDAAEVFYEGAPAERAAAS